MSDTPRTDAQFSVWVNTLLRTSFTGIDREFARDLERDLTAAKAKLAMAEKALENYGHHLPGCGNTGCNCGLDAALKYLREP